MKTKTTKNPSNYYVTSAGWRYAFVFEPSASVFRGLPRREILPDDFALVTKYVRRPSTVIGDGV